MKFIILAFAFSLFLHFLLFTTYEFDLEDNQEVKKEHNMTKSDIKYVILKKEEIIKPETKEQKEIKKTKEKSVPKETTIKKEIAQAKKVEKKEIKKAKEFQEKVLKEQIVKEDSIQNKTLENFLSQKEPVNQEILNELQKLYKEEYDTFTKVQKAFLEKNLNNFQIITQRVLNRLGYPRLAAKLRLSGTNIVEFMFHPNGDISDLKIISSSGYEIFDSYTLELIEIAYKDYPKPKTSTKIRFNVQYTAY